MSLTHDHFRYAWIGWVLLFIVIESAAIFSDARRATLSNQIRDWLSDRPTWVIVVAWIFMLGLTAHFLVDLRRGE